MARRKGKAGRNIATYEHPHKERVNNPPAGLVTPETDRDAGERAYAHDPHLDPHLSWSGKAEHTSFEVPTASLHVHERIDPRTVIEAVRKTRDTAVQGSVFAAPEENPPLRQAIEFYRHRHNWTNRLIAGDSLLVMNSLIEKEGLGGQVRMIHIDPPYGIRYGPNFQPFVNHEVTDGRDADLTAEPEQIRAFRDTWELGIHSYLSYATTGGSSANTLPQVSDSQGVSTTGRYEPCEYDVGQPDVAVERISQGLNDKLAKSYVEILWRASSSWSAPSTPNGRRRRSGCCTTFATGASARSTSCWRGRNGRVVGVEVKASATVRRTDFNGLATLAEFAGTAFERGLLLYTGTRALPFHRGPVKLYAVRFGHVTAASH